MKMKVVSVDCVPVDEMTGDCYGWGLLWDWQSLTPEEQSQRARIEARQSKRATLPKEPPVIIRGEKLL